MIHHQSTTQSSTRELKLRELPSHREISRCVNNTAECRYLGKNKFVLLSGKQKELSVVCVLLVKADLGKLREWELNWRHECGVGEGNKK